MTTVAEPPRATRPRPVARPAGRSGLGSRARTDRMVRELAGSAGWLSLLLVTGWWIADGGLRDLGGWETGLTSLGRLSGLIGSVLLLAQVMMMARVPALERAFGQDRLAVLHRLIGFTSFSLVLFHVLTVTWGYAAGSLAALPGMLWTLTVEYPGMLLASAGTGFLVLVALTSIKASRRRLRYESWHLLHLYGYLGAGLALPHQLWTGQQFLASPARTAFWWSAWAVTAAAVLIWRIGAPLRTNLRHRLRVTTVAAEAPGIWSVYLTGHRIDRLRAEAGQFFTWRFLDGPGWSRGNPYSLSAAPDGRSLRVTVQVVGDGSTRVARLRPGTRVLIEGPFGRLSARPRTRRKVALIGAGVGITPLRALAEGLDYDPGGAVYLERFTDRPLFTAELETLSRERGLQVLRLPGHRRSPGSWLGDGVGAADDLAALRFWVPDIAERDVYVCGPAGWTEAVRLTLQAAGLPEDRLHLETFTW